MLFEGSEEDPELPRPRRAARPGAAARRPPGPEDPAHGLEPHAARAGGGAPALRGVPDGAFFYFVHSYYPDPARAEDVALATEHGAPFCAAVARDNVFACQFHPEKSQARRACALACRGSSMPREPTTLSARMLIFPAIDLLGGTAVRLEQGRRESAKVYAERPGRSRQRFAAARRPAAPRRRSRRRVRARRRRAATNNRATIARSSRRRALEVEVGGGVRTLDDCARALRRWASATSCSAPRRSRTPAWSRRPARAGRSGIVVAVDAREGKVAVEGWTEDTGADAVELGAAVARAGAAAVLYTDIGRDGMRTRPEPRRDGAARARAAPPAR